MRRVQMNGPIYNNRSTPQRLANDRDSFFNNSLLANMSYNESKQLIDEGDLTNTWTGSNGWGYLQTDCSGWSTNSGASGDANRGGAGTSNDPNYWSNYDNMGTTNGEKHSCDKYMRLYCISQ